MRRLAIGTAILLFAVFAACGRADSHVVANGNDTATGEAESDRLAEQIRSSDAVGVTLTPPSDSDRATVTSDDASATLTKVFGPNALKDMSPKLAVLNNKVMGDIQPDGSVKPYYVHRLVWAFVGYNTCAPLTDSLSGIITKEHGTSTTSHPVECIGVLTVDAATGEYLMGYTAAKDAYELEQKGIQEQSAAE